MRSPKRAVDEWGGSLLEDVHINLGQLKIHDANDLRDLFAAASHDPATRKRAAITVLITTLNYVLYNGTRLRDVIGQ